MISVQDAKVLVELARNSIESFFSGNLIPMDEADKFNEKQGVFVTINRFGKLRGCIGFPEPVYELKRGIIDAARSAAFRDPRFPPVVKEELDDITVEISVLTKPKLFEYENPDELLNLVKIGKHGLIIKKGFNSGLLLPQVFMEHESTPKEALEMTCEKAGLPTDAWKSPDAMVYYFSADVFSELEPHGEVARQKENF